MRHVVTSETRQPSEVDQSDPARADQNIAPVEVTMNKHIRIGVLPGRVIERDQKIR